jgi:hypothetical protein
MLLAVILEIDSSRFSEDESLAMKHNERRWI